MSIWKAKECEQSSSSLCLWYRVFLRQMFKSEDWGRKKRSISWNHCLPDWGVWQWLWTWVWVNRQTINKKIQKDQNLKKQDVGSKSKVLHMHSATAPQRVGRPPISPTQSLDPSLPHSRKHLAPTQGASKGISSFWSLFLQQEPQ